MSDDAAGEWLTVAAAEVAEYPADILAAACCDVRRSVSWHGDIVPALVERCEQAVRVRRFRERPPAPSAPPPPREPAPPMTQREVDRLPATLVSLGLACGALVRDGNGRVRVAPDHASARQRGGYARGEALTPERRRELAARAAAKRWRGKGD